MYSNDKIKLTLWFIVFGLRNGIIATATPGMTTKNPFYRKPASSKDTVFLQCFYSVLRTGRVVPTGSRSQRGNKFLIAPYQYNEWQGGYFFYGSPGSQNTD